jgi:hypothetical protein
LAREKMIVLVQIPYMEPGWERSINGKISEVQTSVSIAEYSQKYRALELIHSFLCGQS